MSRYKDVPFSWKKLGIRSFIGTHIWIVLFSGLCIYISDVSAFSLTTRCFGRSHISPLVSSHTVNQKQPVRALSGTIKLYESNKGNERDKIDVTYPITSDTGDKSKDSKQGVGKSSNSNGEKGELDYSQVTPQVVPQRWVQLAYLSLLALLSDWVCFSVAAAPSTFESNFGHSASSIIDIFLFTNVATSFFVTDIVSKFGLQRAIQGAAIFMTTGCWFRSGFGFVPNDSFAETGNILVDYPWIVAGTVLVGIAQPFFQCTPPLLSAKWFANNERSTSTAIALNFNQIGIATAFLVGGAMATDTVGLEKYFGVIACMTTVVTLGTLLQFENEPPFPPSSSELEKLIRGEEEPPFLDSVQKFFSTKGFSRALAAFICSISITNVVGVSVNRVQLNFFFQ